MDTEPLDILLVEDNPTIAGALRLALESEGHLLRVEEDGLAAQRRLEREWPDLLLVDIMLPGLDGFTLCAWTRDRQPMELYLPVVVLTALDMPIQKRLGFEHGAHDYITKPFDMNVLLAKVRIWGQVGRCVHELYALRRDQMPANESAATPSTGSTAAR